MVLASDGGHTYIEGKAEHPPHGTVDAWAYFDFEDRPKEEDFERRYAGGDLEIRSDSWDYYPSSMQRPRPNHALERTAAPMYVYISDD